jgi:hypothetical protein
MSGVMNGKAQSGQATKSLIKQIPAVQKLPRVTFDIPRAIEYFDLGALESMTGQTRGRFADVALKELLDNALDAAESAGVAPVVHITIRRKGRWLRLVIADNAGGLTEETVSRILNFQSLVSDKAAYRSPTRGLQGNALKTIIGIPYALGSCRPVVIEALGKRHIVRPDIDPAGELHIQHDMAEVNPRPGTRIALALPLKACSSFKAGRWARAFSLFNPHATVKIRKIRDLAKQSELAHLANSARQKRGKSYRPTVTFLKDWRKYLPTDRTSPWWYDSQALAKLMCAHIAAAKKGGAKLTLRQFVQQFRGLSGTGAAKAVCDQFPGVSALSDLGANKQATAQLLRAMRAEVKPPSVEVLGSVGEAHFRDRCREWFGLRRHWYQKTTGGVDGVPFLIEAFVAETDRPGGFFHAINFSPTFADPLADTHLQAVGRKGRKKEDFVEFSCYGLGSFLERAHAHPRCRQGNVRTAVAVHLVCPALQFLDKGKTRLSVPSHMARAVAKTVWSAVKQLHREEEQRRKDAARQERAARNGQRDPALNLALTVAVPQVLAAAVEHATAKIYQVSAHTLFYSVRPRVQELTTRELAAHYFEQDLLPAYQQEHGPILLPDGRPAIYYEPRGTLYEPHTSKDVPLGTREIKDYQFPAWLYDKILFVEKQGLWPVLKEAKLAERYDMAIVAGEGYATEACRVLFANADRARNYQLFVLHDADPYGYNIARTLREETGRMPGHKAEVIDLGLSLPDALEMELQTEEFTRQKALPQGLELTALEREYFTGEQKTFGKHPSWVARRVELNALTAPELVSYIERKLQEAGVRGKVIPSADELPQLAERLYRAAVGERVRESVDHFLSVIAESLANDFRARIPLHEARRWVEEAIVRDDQSSWQSALGAKLREILTEGAQELERSLWAKLGQQINRQ